MSNPARRKPGAGDADKVHSGFDKAATDLDGDEFLSFESLLQGAASSGGGEAGKDADVVESPFKARGEMVLARNKGDAIIEQAKQEAERIRQEAYQQGFDEGKREAREQESQLLSQYEELLAQLQAQRVELYKQYEGDILALVKVMVERLANLEAVANPQSIRNCLQKAMEFVVDQGDIKVQLNPEDFQRIRAVGLEDPAFLKGKSKVHLIEDSTISIGEVDATIENCRDRLFSVIDKAFFAASSEEPPGE